MLFHKVNMYVTLSHMLPFLVVCCLNFCQNIVYIDDLFQCKNKCSPFIYVALIYIKIVIVPMVHVSTSYIILFSINKYINIYMHIHTHTYTNHYVCNYNFFLSFALFVACELKHINFVLF